VLPKISGQSGFFNFNPKKPTKQQPELLLEPLKNDTVKENTI
jgi:hypothetical protein